MSDASKCPQCKSYIIGRFCYKCRKDIKDMVNTDEIPGFLKEIFKGDMDYEQRTNRS